MAAQTQDHILDTLARIERRQLDHDEKLGVVNAKLDAVLKGLSDEGERSRFMSILAGLGPALIAMLQSKDVAAAAHRAAYDGARRGAHNPCGGSPFPSDED